MKKGIVLCADDYGQAEAISQAIIDLIEKNRLSATSAMVNTMHWDEHANALTPFKDRVDIGLHFNLTEGKALSREYRHAYGEDFYPLPHLLRKAMLGRLDPAVIAIECDAQIECFANAMGFLPRFLDGHQHVHQFPIIRDAVLEVYLARLGEGNAYMRLVNESMKASDFLTKLKKFIIHATGGKALKELLEHYKIPHNSSFAGIYRFTQADSYPTLFPTFLKTSQNGGLIMCHPGLFTLEGEDGIAKARYEEYQYFMSEKFLKDCADAHSCLKRFAG